MPFLTAKWRYLIMINYEIDPLVLTPFIPKGTQLDLWQDKALISLVGFMFLDTRVKGFAIPFHTDFEEVNLRFYVKKLGSDKKRGVAFIKEIVPKRTIARLARYLYNENYISLPMNHLIEEIPSLAVEYQWKLNNVWQKIRVESSDSPHLPAPHSEAEFITEHYWGYSSQIDGNTMEYQVQHPPWRVWPITHYHISINMHELYGPDIAHYLEQAPISTFLADGSLVQVFKGQII